MKIQYYRPHRKNGYASMLTTITLSMTLIGFSLNAYRVTRQASTIQKTNQVRLDYEQKEKAFLKSLLHLVPNAAIRTMQKDSNNISNELTWEAIFTKALQQAGVDSTYNESMASNLGLSTDLIKANAGDGVYNPLGMISSPNGGPNFVLPATTTETLPPEIAGLPLLNYSGSEDWKDAAYPAITTKKRLPGESDQFAVHPYPDIHFGYSDQNDDFIAKRNWWAFSVNWGANNAATTGVDTSERTYVLSIYEVPTQLALSSSGAVTRLGRFSDGTDWSNVSIQGSTFAKRAVVDDLSHLGPIASRDGISLSSSAPVNQTLADWKERREIEALVNSNATGDSGSLIGSLLGSLTGGLIDATNPNPDSTVFYPYSTSADSGLVSFTPINRAEAFFDWFADENQDNRVGTTDWRTYSNGARNCKLRFELRDMVSTSDQTATEVRVYARFNDDSQTKNERCKRGELWNRPGEDADDSTATWAYSPSGNDWPLQTMELPDGRPGVSLDLEKLPNFLAQIGADDVTINRSIWIGPNYNRGRVNKANYPSTTEDVALVISRSTDLSAYTNGLSIVTPMRVYFADDLNDVPTTPPAGSGITGEWYPPVSIFAPEKRFGTEPSAGRIIDITGQLGYMPGENDTSDLHPLDLKEGGTNTSNSNNIRATLVSIDNLVNLPPINSMNWITVIEEAHQAPTN